MKEAVATLKRLCRQRKAPALQVSHAALPQRPALNCPAAPVSHPLGSCCAFVGRGMTRSLPVRQTGCPSP